MEVVDVDEIVMLNGKPARRVCGVDGDDEWKSAETPASVPT